MKRTQVGGDHYIKLGIQPFDYSESNELGARQHTAIKYITRYKDKNGLEDLKKARDVVDQMIAEELKVDEYKAVHRILVAIKNSGIEYNTILVIGRGGLWAAAQIGYSLGIKTIIGEYIDSRVDYGRILFVDDICDTGSTIERLDDSVDTAVLVTRDKRFVPARLKEPDYSGSILYHNEYVTFPLSQPFDTKGE